MTLVEQVAGIISDIEEGSWGARDAAAADVIAAVFDWLADPGDGAIEAGAIAVAPGIMVEGWDDTAGMRDSCRGDASDTWTAMLAAKRKEALGDEGEG